MKTEPSYVTGEDVERVRDTSRGVWYNINKDKLINTAPLRRLLNEIVAREVEKLSWLESYTLEALQEEIEKRMLAATMEVNPDG